MRKEKLNKGFLIIENLLIMATKEEDNVNYYNISFSDTR
jgi:hypothetical protein